MDRKKIICTFENYVSNYNLNDPNIYLEYKHTGKVAENCERIAKSLNLSEQDIDLAWEIGMLHDIGRFVRKRAVVLPGDKRCGQNRYLQS